MPLNLVPIETGTELGTIYLNSRQISSISRHDDILSVQGVFSRIGMISGESFTVQLDPEEVWKLLSDAEAHADGDAWSTMP